MTRQLTAVVIDLKADNGVTNASFQGYPTNVELYSGSLDWEPRYFADVQTDKSLSGRLRSRLQGYRLTGRLEWERTLEIDTIAAVLDRLPYGQERHFYAGTTNTVSGSATTVNIDPPVATSNGLYGMGVTFDGALARTIVSSTNTTITLNAAVGVAGTEEVRITTNASMPTRAFIGINTAAPSDTREVILEGTIASLLERTIVRQPVSVTVEGVDIEATIPQDYLL